MALYSRGSYDQAAQRFFEAADLDPSDPAPYLFLGKISSRAITNRAGYAATYAALRPASSRKRLGELLLCRPLSLDIAPSPGACSKKLSVSIPSSATLFCCWEFYADAREFAQSDFSLPERDRGQPSDGRGALPAGDGVSEKRRKPTKRKKNLSSTSNCGSNRRKRWNANVPKSNNLFLT